MYSNNFVVAILHNGQFCNDKNGIVAIPFGAEYKIRLRNKNNRRAVATVYVDNENVSKGGVVVNGNSYVDVDGPIDSHTNFKFVSSSSGEAIDQGKNDVQDGSNGLIRVEWRLEKEYKPYYRTPYIQPSWPYPVNYNYGRGDIAKGLKRELTSRGPCGQSVGHCSETYCSSPVLGLNNSSLEEGCTVPGSYSNQSWSTTHVDLESTITTIQLILKGFYPEIEPVTSTDGFCDNCGKKALRRNSKFCDKCGHRLT